ncbi:DUF92 domain-containing protein [Fodinibius sediminis]|uniref:TIGR00297 family protein n=1 Tax=Fodinibius sediminis TaxID=1214077 RepID=A0A521F2Z1_9BACT|nr:DUF92 domain-containing protein [Fodinibius sediminis]SMO90554.1 TIGR00297 family protein [Fodinibius sediminis]
MGNPVPVWNILVGFLASFLFSLAAFGLQRLSLDGMFAATVIGTIVFGFGGWAMVFIVLLFFISSSLISGSREAYADEVRRSGIQVWANGFWLITFLVLAVILETNILLIGSLSAVAAATADTWATELRDKRSNGTYLVTTFKPVAPGTDGGVSIRGTIWASIGSLLIALVSAYFFSLGIGAFLIIFAAGFSGCLIDSYFGAAFQQNNRPVSIPFRQEGIRIDNNLVNAISTGLGALLAIILRTLTV